MSDQVFELIHQEETRQLDKIGLIPSENAMAPEVASVLGSCLSTKYSEGYPNRRYYEGNQFIDQIEILAQERIKSLFGVPKVNVQPYSGSPANLAILFALLEPGETLLGLKLTAGGHLTHGHPKVTASGKFFNSVQFGLNEQGRIDYDEVRSLAQANQPKVMIVGTTAYPFIIDFKKLGEIADEVGAYLVADISHIAGLVVAGEHPSPVPYAHVVMSTTHKTFRGPRGAMILTTDKGLAKNPKLDKMIDSAIIPGLQGGPHNATTAAIAVAADLATKPNYKKYVQQITKNAVALADELQTLGLDLVGGGTETHLMVLDLTKQGFGLGKTVAVALDAAGIWANANTVLNDPASPLFPSGLRLGTPLVTTRGMTEADMKKIAGWIAKVVDHVKSRELPQDKKLRSKFVADWQKEVAQDKFLANIAKEVKEFARQFPLFKD